MPDREGNLVDNPLLVSSRDGEPWLRPTENVFLAGIVGVPWQDLARTDDGNNVTLQAGLKTARELADDGAWDVVLGDPESGRPPSDPHMVESIEPRSGRNPVTGDAIADVDAQADANSINGHEHVVSNDLQFACIFDLPEEAWVDCATVSHGSCDCDGSPEEQRKALCQDEQGNYSTVQRRAKAYPSLRQLGVLRGIGDQAVVASICPEAIDPTEASLRHYGYRPAIAALTSRLKERLHDPCLQRSLTPDEQGQVPCIILEGRRLDPGESCGCIEAGRRPVSSTFRGAEIAAREDVVSQAQGLDCFCELEQLAGEPLSICQNQPGAESSTQAGEPVDGWCYVDATTLPPIGDPQLVAHCPSVEQRTIRFVGEGHAAMGATMFLTCQQGT